MLHAAPVLQGDDIQSRLSFLDQAGASGRDRQTPVHHKTYHTPDRSRNQPKGLFSPLPIYRRHHTAKGSTHNQSKSLSSFPISRAIGRRQERPARITHAPITHAIRMLSACYDAQAFIERQDSAHADPDVALDALLENTHYMVET